MVVTQGNRKIASENKQLGVFNLDGIAPARRGVPQLKVKFDLDSNGVLSVTATDTATGKDQSIRIEGSSNLDDSELERMRKDAELHEKEDQERVDRQNKINQAESMINSAEKQLEEQGDKLTAETKKDVEEKLDSLKAVFNVKDEERDMNAVDGALNALQQSLWKAAEEIYKTTNPQQDNDAETVFTEQDETPKE